MNPLVVIIIESRRKKPFVKEPFRVIKPIRTSFVFFAFDERGRKGLEDGGDLGGDLRWILGWRLSEMLTFLDACERDPCPPSCCLEPNLNGEVIFRSFLTWESSG